MSQAQTRADRKYRSKQPYYNPTETWSMKNPDEFFEIATVVWESLR